jgi:hypothetical protein
MTKSKRQVSFFVDAEKWKQFSKKCIDKDKSKTEILTELIERFLKE